jgi:hypothetical protein
VNATDLEEKHGEFIAAAGGSLRPIADRAWDLERARLEGCRYVVIDLEAAASPFEHSHMGEQLQNWVAILAVSSFAERFCLLAKAVIALAAHEAPWRVPQMRARSISVKPAESSDYRRCVRVLAMVHELHKAGYQRIRVLPMLSPSGSYWRAMITVADNVARDGYHIIDDDPDDREGIVARYSSGQENEFFGWKDAKPLNARELAALFVQRFPVITRRGEGGDWAYAGWLTDVFGEAEAGPDGGSLIHLVQDWAADPSYMRRWQPPPPPRDLGS